MNKISAAVPSWSKSITRANEVLQEKFGADIVIDEISLLFPNLLMANNFALDAIMEEDVVMFNRAADHVHTWPLDNHYDVDYLFLTLPDPIADVRLEMMAINSGFSALHHSTLASLSEQQVVIHLSFKCQSENDYQSMVDMMCSDDDFWLVQACRSDYGRFSYFSTPLMEGRVIYLKPRVNLRDEMLKDLQATAEKHEDAERGEFGLPGVGGMQSGLIPRQH